jgi:uncharacterized damage-inducible protein DinB
MTSREQFLETLKDEQPRFERVFAALPEARLEYRPHEKSRSAKELLGVFADEALMFADILGKGELEMGGFTPGSYAGVTAAAEAFGRGFAEAAREGARLSDADWKLPARMLMNGKSEWETTRGGMAWGLLLDLIHHRGQLSVYLRPMGGRVPAIYGPSGDGA